MDFSSIIHAAKQNDRKTSKVNYYPAKFSAPKKETKSEGLSAGIRSFLAKQAQEKLDREKNARKKLEELQEARSQDTKSKKRVSLMLKSTKAFNKSAIADAVDDVNTAVTALGPDQPDEDDYGYTSKEASEFYTKLMDKYSNAPAEDPKFSKKQKTTVKSVKQMNETKDRVRQALEKEREEEMMPHRRKRKHKEKSEDDGPSRKVEDEYEDEYEAPPPPKPKQRPPPPVMNFQELLLLAAQKKNEPIVVEAKTLKNDEPERPMTKRQRLEYEKEKKWREHREEREAARQREEASRKLVSSDRRAEDRRTDPAPPSLIKTPTFARIPKKSASNKPEQSSSDTKRPAPLPPRQEQQRPSQSRPEQRPIQSKPSKPESPRETLPSSSSDRNPYKQPQKPNGYKSASSDRDRDMSSKSISKPADNRNVPMKGFAQKSSLPARSPSFSQTAASTSQGPPIRSKLPPREETPRPRDASIRQPEPRQAYDKRPAPRPAEQDRRPPLDKRPGDQDRRPQLEKKRPVDQNRKPQDQVRKPMDQDRKSTSDRRPLEQSRRPEVERRAIDQDRRPVDKRSIEANRKPVADRRPAEAERKPPMQQERRPAPPPPVKARPPALEPRYLPPAPRSANDRRPPPPGQAQRQGSNGQGPRPGQSRPMPPQQRRRPQQPPGKRRIESDSEYDSELDDFIDDGPAAEEENYSEHIKQIFGYDKSRYRDFDDDDECMESNFAQQMKEEYNSTKLGMLEDLEDIQKEQMEKKRKKAVMKKRRGK